MTVYTIVRKRRILSRRGAAFRRDRVALIASTVAESRYFKGLSSFGDDVVEVTDALPLTGGTRTAQSAPTLVEDPRSSGADREFDDSVT